MLFPYGDTRELLSQAMKYAYQIGKSEKLLECLHRLGHGHHNNGKEYVCILNKDFAPLSFVFSYYKLSDVSHFEDGNIVMKRGTDPFMNGGLIYSGPLPKRGMNTDENTFSVNIDKHVGWSIHT